MAVQNQIATPCAEAAYVVMTDAAVPAEHVQETVCTASMELAHFLPAPHPAKPENVETMDAAVHVEHALPIKHAKIHTEPV